MFGKVDFKIEELHLQIRDGKMIWRVMITEGNKQKRAGPGFFL
jgi:hypothetical protein